MKLTSSKRQKIEKMILSLVNLFLGDKVDVFIVARSSEITPLLDPGFRSFWFHGTGNPAKFMDYARQEFEKYVNSVREKSFKKNKFKE